MIESGFPIPTGLPERTSLAGADREPEHFATAAPSSPGRHHGCPGIFEPSELLPHHMKRMDTHADGGVARDRLSDLVRADLYSSYRLAAVILSDPVEAEDATHDAVVLAIRNWHTLRDATRASAWLQRILVNECRRRLRSRSRGGGQVHEIPVSVVDPTEAWVEHDAMWDALSRLDPDHRLVVVLAYYADLTLGEIADRLGIRPGTVKSRLHYGLRLLRAEYDTASRTPLEVSNGRRV